MQHGLNIKEIVRTSRLVAMTTGYSVQPNKAVVGLERVRARERDPSARGARATARPTRSWTRSRSGWRATDSCSASTAAATRSSTRWTSSASRWTRARSTARSRRFKDLADRKVQLTDQDLDGDRGRGARGRPTRTFSCSSPWSGGRRHAPPAAATVRLRRATRLIEESAIGDGMIDAAMGAIARAAGVEARLVSFHVSAVTGGSDALGDVVVQLEIDGRRVTGRGVATDVVEASARAYLAAVNRALQVQAGAAAVERGHAVTERSYRDRRDPRRRHRPRGRARGPEGARRRPRGVRRRSSSEFDLGADRYLRTGEVLPDDELERLRALRRDLPGGGRRPAGEAGHPRARPAAQGPVRAGPVGEPAAGRAVPGRRRRSCRATPRTT